MTTLTLRGSIARSRQVVAELRIETDAPAVALNLYSDAFGDLAAYVPNELILGLASSLGF
jgi:hypothetical protein